MATLTVLSLVRTGVDVAGVAADGTNGDEWVNTGAEFVLVRNGGGAPITITLDVKVTVDGAAVVDPTVTLANGATKLIGPFPKGIYNDSTTGRAKISYSSATSVTVAVVRGSIA